MDVSAFVRIILFQYAEVGDGRKQLRKQQSNIPQECTALEAETFNFVNNQLCW